MVEFANSKIRQPAPLNDLQIHALKKKLFGIYYENPVVEVIKGGVPSSGTILRFSPPPIKR